jgi:hypothetical protein
VGLITRAGNDFLSRFPFIAMALSKLPVRSCLVDGEAIVCNENGLAVFELSRIIRWLDGTAWLDHSSGWPLPGGRGPSNSWTR